MWDNLASKTSFRSSTQILLKSVFRPNPLGPPVAKVPLFITCNTVLEKGLHSARSAFGKTQNQILDGADLRKLIIRDHQNACEYFDIMEKRIFIQQKALAYLSKSVAHIPQRELYTLGNTSLLPREAEMTLLHPHLGESRRQELRNSPFWTSPFLKSQLMKYGEVFLLKKALAKTLRVLDPIKQALSWSPPQ